LKDEIINQIAGNKVTDWQGATQVLTVVNLATGEEDETSDNVKVSFQWACVLIKMACTVLS
jgi:hypothetical protein